MSHQAMEGIPTARGAALWRDAWSSDIRCIYLLARLDRRVCQYSVVCACIKRHPHWHEYCLNIRITLGVHHRYLFVRSIPEDLFRFTGFADLEHFFISRMYSASAFAANTMVRSALAAAFPLFISQMFIKVSITPRIRFTPVLIYIVAVGCQLGIDAPRINRFPLHTLSIPILQVWSPYSCQKHVCTFCCTFLLQSFRWYNLTLDSLPSQDLRIAKELKLEQQAATV